MRKLLITAFLLALSTLGYAGDYHEADSTQTIVYTLADNSGHHISGQTIRLTVYNPATNKYLDFSDNTFKNLSSVTTLSRALNENTVNGMYFTTITVDTATMVSADIVVTVSNDSAIYGDLQSESVTIGRLERLIKINR